MPDHADVNPQGLTDMLRRAGADGRRIPPVDSWEPEFCGAIDIRIARDGTWYYRGTPIQRDALVRLFSTVLRRDSDGYVLVTPVEKLGISVEDVPFIGVEMHSQGQGRAQVLHIRTNVGDVVEVGAQHPLRFEQEQVSDGLLPYVLVRGKLEAKLARPLLYQLADLAVEEHCETGPKFGVWSGGHFFELPGAE